MRNALISFIHEEFFSQGQPTELDDDTNLLETGIVDSFGLLRIVAFLEDELEISIDPEALDADAFSTVRGILEVIERSQEAVA